MNRKWNIRTDHTVIFVLMIFVLIYRMKASYPFPLDWYLQKTVFVFLILASIMIRKITQNLVAYKLGDINFKINSQKIWNPLFMIDWIGILPFILLGYGWAKPIGSKKATQGDNVWIRFQIIGSGFISTLIFAFVFKWLSHQTEGISLTLAAYMKDFAILNANYFLFSLLPIPPLDGWLLFKALQRGKVKLTIDEIYGYSFLLFMFIIKFQEVIFPGPLSRLLLQWI